MASIVSSVIAWDRAQIDGRRIVRELHTDDLGNEYPFDYMAEANEDVTATMAVRLPSVLVIATDYQAQQNLDNP